MFFNSLAGRKGFGLSDDVSKKLSLLVFLSILEGARADDDSDTGGLIAFVVIVAICGCCVALKGGGSSSYRGGSGYSGGSTTVGAAAANNVSVEDGWSEYYRLQAAEQTAKQASDAAEAAYKAWQEKDREERGYVSEYEHHPDGYQRDALKREAEEAYKAYCNASSALGVYSHNTGYRI